MADPTPSHHWLEPWAIRIASWRPLFTAGWGEAEVVDAARQGALSLPDVIDAAPRQIQWRTRTSTLKGTLVRDGRFVSPVDLPRCAATAQVRCLRRHGNRKLFIVLAGTGEVGYGMRTRIWAPLLREGVDLLFLENPFYGPRCRPEQRGSSLMTVSDLLLLVRAAVAEAASLVAWGREQGYHTVALGGYSMGAYMSLMAAAKVPGHLKVFALSAGITPVPVFTAGMLSKLVRWRSLADGERARTIDEARSYLGEVLAIGDLRRSSVLPKDKSVHILALERDAYITRQDTEELAQFIPHAEVAYVPLHGHVSAVLAGRKVLLPFVRARI